MSKTNQGLTRVALPFTIDETDFTLWLSSLPSDDEVKSCEQILQVLQTLNKTHQSLASKTRLFFLNKLGNVLFELTNNLTSAAYSIEKTKAYLSIWSCSELANGYIILSEEKRFGTDYYTDTERAQIIQAGLQAMSKALLYTSQAYARPYLYFWAKCYQLYQKAAAVPSDINTPGAHAIDDVFKHILVFSLSNTNQFSPQEMKVIFHFLSNFALYAKFLQQVPEKKFTGIPYINYKNDLPPTLPSTLPAPEDEHTVYIATAAIAQKVLEHVNLQRQQLITNERLLLMRLAKILTLNRQRKHPRVINRGSYFGIIGFSNLISFFRQHESEKNPILKIGELDLTRPGELRELNFEILPHEETLNPKLGESYGAKKIQQQLRSNPTEIWDYHKKIQFEANATQTDKSLSGYGLIWQDKNIEPRVGDVIGLQNQIPSIGFIRWIAQSPTSVLLFGVELLGFNAQAVTIFNTSISNSTATGILIQNQPENTDRTESLIVDSCELVPSEFIHLQIKDDAHRYRVIKQLHTTTLLNHIQITKA